MKPTLTQWGQKPSGLRQPNPISALGLSRNGRFAVTGDRLGNVRVFELSPQRLVATVKVPRKWVSRHGGLAAVSVSDDGKIVTSFSDKRLVRGTIDSWEPECLQGCDAGLVSPDGTWTASIQGWLYFHQGEREPKSHWQPQSRATDLSFSASGRVVAAFERDDQGVLRVMDAKTQTIAVVEIAEELRGAKVGFVDEETVIAVTPRGRVHEWTIGNKAVKSWSIPSVDLSSFSVLLAPLKTLVRGKRVIDLATGKVVREVEDLEWAVSADGSVLISADGATIIQRGTDLFEPFVSPGLTAEIRSLRFEPSGEFAWSGDDEALRRWRVSDGQVESTIKVPKGHEAVALSADAKTAVLREPKKDGRLMALSLPEGKSLGDPQSRAPHFPTLSPDGSLTVVMRDKEMHVVRWNGKSVCRSPIAHTVGLAFSADGRWIATSGERAEVAIIDAKTGKVERTFPTPNRRPALGIAFSPDGKRLGLLCDAATVFVIGARDGRELYALRGLARNAMWPVVFSPNGKWLAASDTVRTCVWAMSTGKKAFSDDTRSFSLAFSPDSKLLLIGGAGSLSALAL